MDDALRTVRFSPFLAPPDPVRDVVPTIPNAQFAWLSSDARLVGRLVKPPQAYHPIQVQAAAPQLMRELTSPLRDEALARRINAVYMVRYNTARAPRNKEERKPFTKRYEVEPEWFIPSDSSITYMLVSPGTRKPRPFEIIDIGTDQAIVDVRPLDPRRVNSIASFSWAFMPVIKPPRDDEDEEEEIKEDVAHIYFCLLLIVDADNVIDIAEKELEGRAHPLDERPPGYTEAQERALERDLPKVLEAAAERQAERPAAPEPRVVVVLDDEEEEGPSYVNVKKESEPERTGGGGIKRARDEPAVVVKKEAGATVAPPRVKQEDAMDLEDEPGPLAPQLVTVKREEQQLEEAIEAQEQEEAERPAKRARIPDRLDTYIDKLVAHMPGYETNVKRFLRRALEDTFAVDADILEGELADRPAPPLRFAAARDPDGASDAPCAAYHGIVPGQDKVNLWSMLLKLILGLELPNAEQRRRDGNKLPHAYAMLSNAIPTTAEMLIIASDIMLTAPVDAGGDPTVPGSFNMWERMKRLLPRAFLEDVWCQFARRFGGATEQIPVLLRAGSTPDALLRRIELENEIQRVARRDPRFVALGPRGAWSALKHYQQCAAERMVLRELGGDGPYPGLMVAMKTGLGKTRTALVASLVAAAVRGERRAVTIVATQNSIIYDWVKECDVLNERGYDIQVYIALSDLAKATPALKQAHERLWNNPGEADFILTNFTHRGVYGAARRVAQRLVVDESHIAFVNDDTGTYQSWVSFAGANAAENIPALRARFLLTATPFRKERKDLLQQITFLRSLERKQDIVGVAKFTRKTKEEAMEKAWEDVHVVGYGPATAEIVAHVGDRRVHVVKERQIRGFDLSPQEKQLMDIITEYCVDMGRDKAYAYAGAEQKNALDKILVAVTRARELSASGYVLGTSEDLIKALKTAGQQLAERRAQREGMLKSGMRSIMNFFTPVPLEQLKTLDFDWLGQKEGLGGIDSARSTAFRAWLRNEFLSNPAYANEKVVVFSWFRTTLEVLSLLLEREGQRSFIFDGSVKLEKRPGFIDDFNDEDNPTRFMLMTYSTGGLGINLQRANWCVFFDGDYTATKMYQAESRVFRIGQKRPVVHVIDFRANTWIDTNMAAERERRFSDWIKASGEEDLGLFAVNDDAEEGNKGLVDALLGSELLKRGVNL